MRRRVAGGAVAFLVALQTSTGPVHAHLIATGLGPVYDGVAHLALTPEDLLPVLALALLAGLRGKPHARRMIIVLPCAWMLGGVAGAVMGTLPLARLTWLPLIVLGALVAADVRLSPVATTVIATLLGGFVGNTNGVAMMQAGLGAGFLVGIAGLAFVIATLVAAFIAAQRAEWWRIAGRVAGSWIAASGLLLLGWSLR